MFGIANLAFASNGKTESTNVEKHSILNKEVDASKKILGEAKWRYLYLSPCGKTFVMTSEVAIQNMTEDQYLDFMYEVVALSNHYCKLFGEKPVYNFTNIENRLIEIKSRV